MLEAIRQAKLAQARGDYAVGAVLAKGNRIISACSNRSKRDENPIAHAEVLAIIEACKKFKSRHLPDRVLYAICEPCPMCTSVIVWARLKAIVYGARSSDMKKYRLSMANNRYFV